MVDDQKRAKRYRASADEWAAMHKSFTRERCWICGEGWSDLHHILPRSQSGDDVVVNLAPLCRQCHDHVELHDVVARAALRYALMPSNVSYLSYRLGGDDRAFAWLERNYPARRAD